VFVYSLYCNLSKLNSKQALGCGLCRPHTQQGRRSSGRAKGAVKELRAMEPYKKRKFVSNFCSATMLSSIIITEIMENHSEFFECVTAAIKFF